MKGKYLQFFLTVLGWCIAGLYINDAYRTYVFIPFAPRAWDWMTVFRIFFHWLPVT
jgi:hypothetical protein